MHQIRVSQEENSGDRNAMQSLLRVKKIKQWRIAFAEALQVAISRGRLARRKVRWMAESDARGRQQMGRAIKESIISHSS